MPHGLRRVTVPRVRHKGAVRYAILASLFLVLPGCGDDSASGDAANDSTTGPASNTDPGTTNPNPGTSTGPSPGTSTGPHPGTTSTPDDTTAGATTTGPDATDSTGPEPTTTGDMQTLPPQNGAELLPWLEAGEYLGWTAESDIHESTGPHLGDVRTFVNDVLFDSLDAGDAAHPMDAATVKELYGSGDTVLGWAVMVKVQADSAGGDGWYWYEYFDGDTISDSLGDGLCTGCHSSGSDYFRSPFPLQ